MIQSILNIVNKFALQGMNIGLDAAILVREQLEHIQRLVIRSLVFLLFGLFGGLIIQKSYEDFGGLVLNVVSLTALAIAMLAFAKIAILVQVCVRGNAALTKTSTAVTKGHVAFPDLLNEVNGQEIIRWSATLLLAISGAAGFANIFPAYQNITGFMTCILLTVFCLVMYNLYSTENKWKIADRILMFAFIMLMVNMVSFVIPQNLKQEMRNSLGFVSNQTVAERTDDRARETTRNDANHSAVNAEQQVIQTLASQRDTLLQKMVADGQLSREDQRALASINRQMANVANGELTNAQSDFSLTSVFQGSSGMIALALLALLLLGVLGSKG